MNNPDSTNYEKKWLELKLWLKKAVEDMDDISNNVLATERAKKSAREHLEYYNRVLRQMRAIEGEA